MRWARNLEEYGNCWVLLGAGETCVWVHKRNENYELSVANTSDRDYKWRVVNNYKLLREAKAMGKLIAASQNP